jgi:hypothetical protein
MVGYRVKWKHLDPHGAPAVKAEGVVIALSPVGTKWIALVELHAGGFRQFDAECLERVPMDDEPSTVAHETPHERGLEETIKSIGLWEDAGKCAVDQAQDLLREFMTELQEKTEEIERLKKKTRAKKEEAQ